MFIPCKGFPETEPCPQEASDSERKPGVPAASTHTHTHLRQSDQRQVSPATSLYPTAEARRESSKLGGGSELLLGKVVLQQVGEREVGLQMAEVRGCPRESGSAKRSACRCGLLADEKEL